MATCNDCIYEPKCISRICHGMGDDEVTGELLTDIDKRCKGFKNKADFQEVQHGEWIKAGTGITERVICSKCKSDKGSYMKPRICNQCGARMDGNSNAE